MSRDKQIQSQPSVRYLGVQLDQKANFKAYASIVAKRADDATGSLRAIMPNTGGPSHHNRKLLALAPHSILLYLMPGHVARWLEDYGAMPEAHCAAGCFRISHRLRRRADGHSRHSADRPFGRRASPTIRGKARQKTRCQWGTQEKGSRELPGEVAKFRQRHTPAYTKHSAMAGQKARQRYLSSNAGVVRSWLFRRVPAAFRAVTNRRMLVLRQCHRRIRYSYAMRGSPGGWNRQRGSERSRRRTSMRRWSPARRRGTRQWRILQV